MRPAKLGVPGEDEFVGSGVSYCVTCDGSFFRDKDVCVVGGGDTAVADAIYLSRICHKVSIIVRRDVLRATAIYNIKLREFDNVEIVWNTTVKEVLGSDFVVMGIKTKNKISGEEGTIDCAALFVAIGTVPNVEFLDYAVERDAPRAASSPTAWARPACPASTPPAYIRSKKLRQITTAVATRQCRRGRGRVPHPARIGNHAARFLRFLSA